ncbi:serine/threonine protein kinase [Candidatus Koribacter versatilis Ellin345]|uniref:non-specific serine/threonine protein kinase n=1 Tax=Koribacter versatilis (strain Ellin345) TaxID=204669 RepID=Q1IIA9_KORVE|nr:protein kinase [Candidatus Koribacter versatilis]ABF43391.1 serine/threonine protein kinase [Candidatus Koribacter versatilis Ellin345]
MGSPARYNPATLMALNPGLKLGPYEIQSPLGAGGMGEVYRATDTRLDRIVAIKILPAHLSANPEARQRFEREARSISALNHPNICALYDIGTQDGTSFLVMEYVQGETLEARRQKGPLPLKQVTEIGIQVCDALEKAHRAGIIHRDLKPGNIMLTASGAKLLDFGLAKAVGVLGAQAATAGTHTPDTPTMNVSALRAPAAGLTQQGTIVGTFQYMAPEAAEGLATDARSDIFSLGCVLYEMVTGRRAFEGKSQLSVLTAILERDPEPISTIQPLTPLALEYTVHTCLEKNPDQRFQTAHDVKLQLVWIAKSGSQASAKAIAGKPQPRGGLWLAAAAGAILAALLVAGVLMSTQKQPRVMRTNLVAPNGMVFETLYRNGPPELSSDGTRVAFVARKDGQNSIWVRSLDKLEATQVQGTAEGFRPFWSPDGTSLAFFAHAKLWRVDLNGVAPVAIADAPEGRGGTWGAGNTIVFAPNTGGPLMEVDAAGGAATPVTKMVVTVQGGTDRWPHFLPDGKHFLYLRVQTGNSSDHNELRVGSVDQSTDTLIMHGGVYETRYVSGWLLVDRTGSLLAWRFDPKNAKTSGEGIQIVGKLATDEVTFAGVFSVSQQGILLYQPGSSETGDRHVWTDASGKPGAQISEPGYYGPTRLSPDGTRVVTPVSSATGDSDIWMWDLLGGARARLSKGDVFVDMPTWSADARTIYFGQSDKDGHEQIRAVPADGSAPERTLLKIDGDVLPVETTKDGRWLLYEELIPGSLNNNEVLKALPLGSGDAPFTVLDSVAAYSKASLKPESNDWLAYQSNESGHSEVYLTRFPHPGAKYQVSQSGATQPLWSKDGKRLYYLDNSQHLISVDIQLRGDSPQIGAPKTLFQTTIRDSITANGYDVTRDGRFLLVNSVMENNAPVVLVTNWETELKK